MNVFVLISRLFRRVGVVGYKSDKLGIREPPKNSVIGMTNWTLMVSSQTLKASSRTLKGTSRTLKASSRTLKVLSRTLGILNEKFFNPPSETG